MLGSIIIAFNGMVLVHEFGHVVGLWVSGGAVDYVQVSPIDFGFTARARDPHPLFVTWAGPLLGSAFPVAILLVVIVAAPRWIVPALMLAVVAFLANGTYLAIGVFSRVGDAGDLMRRGMLAWVLVAVGAPLVGAGVYLASFLRSVLRVGPPETTLAQTVFIVGLPIALYLAAMFATPAVVYGMGAGAIVGAILAALVFGALAGVAAHRMPLRDAWLVRRAKPATLGAALFAIALGAGMIAVELIWMR